MPSSQRLLVSNAPRNFLKPQVIKNHFGNFGSVISVAIHQENKCIVTFQKTEHAENALKNGRLWKNIKLDIEFVAPIVPSYISNVVDFNSGYDIDSELNWFAEEDYEPLETVREQLISEVPEIMDQRKSSGPSGRTDESRESQKKKIPLPIDEAKDNSSKRRTEVKQQTKSSGNEDDISGEDLFKKTATTLNSCLAVLEERDKQLRIRLNRDSNIKTAVSIKGLCPDMCPEKERILRDVRGIVATYESIDGASVKMDHSKAVKDYSRSSADQEEPLAHELRPEPVLSMTLDYLITQIMTKIDTGEEDNFGNWYDFCWYRLRSIRKDIIQQQLCDIKTAEIVEKCARFHICCFDRLWGLSKSTFDDKINSETLMNCLQSLMHIYEDLRKQNVICPNEAEFRAYLILLKLNSGFLLSEYQQYSPLLRKSPQVKDAILIHTAYSNNMYFAYFSLMKKTTYLNSCLMQRFLAHLRTKALEIIVRAHCPPNKISRLPINMIVHMLKFDSRQDCIRFCESFGLIQAQDPHNFVVSRNDFFFPESLFVINTPSSLVVRKRISVAKAVVGINGKLPIYIHHEVHSSFNENGQLKQGALDATDQEEKLFRDIVTRKLILKRTPLPIAEEVTTSEQEVEEIVTPPLSPKILNVPESTSLEMETPSLVDSSSDEESEYIHDESVTSKERTYKDSDLKEEISSDEDNDSVTSISSEEVCEPVSERIDDIDSPMHSESKVTSIDPISPSLKTNFTQPNFNLKHTSILNIEHPTVLVKSPISPKSPSLLKPKFPVIILKSPGKPTKLPTLSPKSPSLPLKSPITSPKSPINSPNQQSDFRKSLIFQSKPLVSPTVSVPSKKRKMTSPSVSSSYIGQSRQLKFDIFLPKKVKNNQEKTCLTKLKKIKSSEKMKKVSIRKYALLWRKKVEKLKKVADKSLRDYLFYWGAPSENRLPKSGIRNRLFQKKKTGLVVLSILHSDVVDRIDPATGKVGKLLSDSLARAAVNWVRIQDNISQPYPVFWKLIFALPPSLKGKFTFPDKLRKWCSTAFYSDPNAQLGEVQYRLTTLGVPIFISVDVLLGDIFEKKCANISAVVVIRAHGWESKEETLQRCEKLISVVDNKFPLAILTLGEKFESFGQLSHRTKLTYFYESMWNDTDKLILTLLNLTQNSYFQRVKVDSLRTLISFNSEKLFDALHEDQFINDGLNDVLSEPNNVIRFYNELIYEIEKEILACYEANFYGTACEFEKYIKESHLEIVQFPSHYKENNFREILKKHLRTACLPEIKWPFLDSKDLLSVFQSYCHNIGCDGILSKLMRTVNPPDSNDFEHPLNKHLELIPWIKIVEDIVKEIIKRDDYLFNVVYRPNTFLKLNDSHWWMSSALVNEALSKSCNNIF